jgi:hypothetical protein
MPEVLQLLLLGLAVGLLCGLGHVAANVRAARGVTR